VLPTGVTTAPASMPGMDMPGVVVTGVRDYTYPLNQRAATLWYHDHRMGFTGPGIWYGLAASTSYTTTRRTRSHCRGAIGTSR